MAGENNVILLGNLGKDPEIKRFESGQVVANFPLATSESYKDKAGEKVEKTEWHNIAIWGKSAEIAEKYLKKGSTIFLEGKIQTRSWETEGGEKRYATDIVGHGFQMVGGKATPHGENAPAPATQTAQPNQAPAPVDEPDDLPF